MSTGTDQDVVAIPPRYWWLKRLAVASALLVALLAAIRPGYPAGRRAIARQVVAAFGASLPGGTVKVVPATNAVDAFGERRFASNAGLARPDSLRFG